jgi:hypothetical protein
VIAALAACGFGLPARNEGPPAPIEETEGPWTPSAPTTPSSGDPTVVPEGPSWIGDPCVADADCTYAGAVCLTAEEGFPGGLCSLSCPDYCPDADGFVETFCPAVDQLPADAAALGDGACTSRCDFAAWPGTGCRDGYGCVVADRANLDDAAWTCLPGRESELPACTAELAASGVGFRPTLRDDESPADHPDLVCSIDEPVWLTSPVEGIDVRYYYASEGADVLLSCNAAGALVETARDVGAAGAVEIVHLGTYNCRTIGGTNTLSQHGLGNAIDLSAFTFADAHTASVFDDWEHGSDAPDTADGAFLYDAVHRWYDDWVWSIILTPEYNDAHDNHFHVDQTPGEHFLEAVPTGRPHVLGVMTTPE